jgi:hypothetical protein
MYDIDIVICKLYSRPRILEHGSDSVSKNKSKIELGLEDNKKMITIAKIKTRSNQTFYRSNCCPSLEKTTRVTSYYLQY